MATCYVPPPGPGETGARVCETFAEIRARQIAYWNDYLRYLAEVNPPIIQTRDPGLNDDYGSGFRIGQLWLNTVSDEVFIAETVSPDGGAIWNLITGSGGGGGADVSDIKRLIHALRS